VSNQPSDRKKERQMMREALDAELEKAAARPSDLPPPEERARLRKALKLKQSQIANILGVHRLTVSAWERGEYDPKGDTRRLYIELLEEMKERIGESDAEDEE
jgi:DNA-binding transcriptional regulator YiaG